MSTQDLVARALGALAKKNLFLSIYDGSFPSEAVEELGRGTPYGSGARKFVAFIRSLGFNGIQLGPQGLTSAGNPSPYDGTVFSRNPLSISLTPLARPDEGPALLSATALEAAVGGFFDRGVTRDRVPYGFAYRTRMRLLQEAFAGFGRLPKEDPGVRAMEQALGQFQVENRSWLEPDALYQALAEHHGAEDFRSWSAESEGDLDRELLCPSPGNEDRCRRRGIALSARFSQAIRFYGFCQWLVHRQHEGFHRLTGNLGLRIYGDLQIGLSLRDLWAHQPLFLADYLLGAPPSRTNPAGQPWGYAVLDPASYRGASEAGQIGLRYFQARLDKVCREFDGVRIDHPQGLVCPWVYRADEADPLRAVQRGARLFESPDLPDHPALTRYALVRPDQLSDRAGIQRHDDDWVERLDPAQVEQYGVLIAALVAEIRNRGGTPQDVTCEILSTLPYPLARVIQHHGLGRLRVTQKARLDDPGDVYRSERADPQDWIMMGNHDTPSIWQVAEDWRRTGQVKDRSAYLAARLVARESRARFQEALSADPRQLVHAELADVFLSPAENVLLFFGDLFGRRERFNLPGVIHPDNWTLRVPPGYQAEYPKGAAKLEMLNLPYALALALRAKGETYYPLADSLFGQPETLHRAP